MHFMQWMDCAMYYEISVFDTTCFQSTIWMLQNVCSKMEYAMYSIIKLPYLFLIYHMDLRNLLYHKILNIRICTVP